jgi:hypothetical protein
MMEDGTGRVMSRGGKELELVVVIVILLQQTVSL